MYWIDGNNIAAWNQATDAGATGITESAAPTNLAVPPTGYAPYVGTVVWNVGPQMRYRLPDAGVFNGANTTAPIRSFSIYANQSASLYYSVAFGTQVSTARIDTLPYCGTPLCGFAGAEPSSDNLARDAANQWVFWTNTNGLRRANTNAPVNFDTYTFVSLGITPRDLVFHDGKSRLIMISDTAIVASGVDPSGARTTIATSTLFGPYDASDLVYVYYAINANAKCEIRKVAADATNALGSIQVLAPTNGQCAGIALGSSSLYLTLVTGPTAGQVVKIPK